MNTDAPQDLRTLYRQMVECESPPPWRRVQIRIGGVVAIGFGADTELLLVVTHSGLGVVDVPSGKVVARKIEVSDDDYNDRPIVAKGIGPLQGQCVPLAGLWGGGLRTMSQDGWVIHRAAPNWPAECIVLCPPDHPEIEDYSTATMLLKDIEPPARALGFSDSGRSLAVANTQLYLWLRNDSHMQSS